MSRFRSNRISSSVGWPFTDEVVVRISADPESVVPVKVWLREAASSRGVAVGFCAKISSSCGRKKSCTTASSSSAWPELICASAVSSSVGTPVGPTSGRGCPSRPTAVRSADRSPNCVNPSMSWDASSASKRSGVDTCTSSGGNRPIRRLFVKPDV